MIIIRGIKRPMFIEEKTWIRKIGLSVIALGVIFFGYLLLSERLLSGSSCWPNPNAICNVLRIINNFIPDWVGLIFPIAFFAVPAHFIKYGAYKIWGSFSLAWFLLSVLIVGTASSFNGNFAPGSISDKAIIGMMAVLSYSIISIVIIVYGYLSRKKRESR